MVGYDESVDDFKHFRVDKMLHTSELKKRRQGRAEFDKRDKEIYTKKHFRMFGGEEERVTLYCTNDMANVIIDQFGREVTLRKVDDEHFEVRVDVVVSNQFFGWIVGLAGKVVIKGPDVVKEQMKKLLEENYIL